MCYAKPGPRCSGHVRKELSAAIEKHGKNSPEAKAAAEAYLHTPQGIKRLKESPEAEDRALGLRYEREYRQAVRASQIARADREWEATNGKQSFTRRVERRAELLYGSNVSAIISSNPMYRYDTRGEPVSLQQEVTYLKCNEYGDNMVIDREVLTDEDAFYDIPREDLYA